jgi:hypothetical protein
MVAAREMEGVLAWAFDGLRTAKMRGSITISSDSLEAKKEIYREANLVEGFIEECVDLDINYKMAHVDFCLTVTQWHVFSHGDGSRRTPSFESIARSITSLHRKDIYKERTESKRWVRGVKLNAQGRMHFEHAKTADAFKGKSVGASMGDPCVFDPIQPKVK